MAECPDCGETLNDDYLAEHRWYRHRPSRRCARPGRFLSVSGMPKLTVELDSGPYEVGFGYLPIGDPAYSDVPSEGPIQPTENDAERYGFRLLAVGNWRSFMVQKRYLGTDACPELIDGSIPRQSDRIVSGEQ